MSLIQGNSKTSAAGGFTIDQSIRFNDGDSPYLNRTFGTPTSNSQFGYSFWIKLGEGYDGKYIISANGGGNNDNFTFQSGQIRIQEGGVLRLRSDQLFNDFSSWYHFVVAYDLGNATASQKLRVYLNGLEITSWTTDTRSSLSSTSSRLNAAVSHDIGANVFNGISSHVNNWDGYIAEFNFVDGAVLSPTDFGETNADTGQWVPIDTSGLDFGTNGFRITGADSSDLGADQAGSNDFSSSGLSSADSVSDSPTANHCTLNPLWVDGYTLSDGNLVTNQSGDAAAIGTMAFDPTDSDGFYFEAKVTTAATYPNVGIRTAESVSQIGAVSNLSGNSTGRFSYTGSNGQFSDEGSGSSYGDAWSGTADKVIGVLVKAGSLYFSVDGTIQNSGTAAKTGLTGLMVPTVFYDAGSGTQAAWEMRFDAADWSTTPSGYKALSTSNLPDPTIADGSLYFNTVLYTGDGSSSTRSITGAGFQPDFVWKKKRSGADHHWLHDAVRGATKGLNSNRTDSEYTSNRLTSFDSDGFSFATSDPDTNGSGATYASWSWKAGNSSGSSNTDGTVSSTVSVSATSGFSVAEWTHTTASNYTVGHGLGAVPKMIWVKTTDQATNWGVYHSDITVGNRLILNDTSTEIAGYWGANSWTSSTFSIGSARDANGSTMIGYCVAEVDGFSRISSYTGDGSSELFVYTGFRPAFVIGKRASGSGGYFDWWIFDDKRPGYNLTNLRLYSNLNAAEDPGAGSLDLVSNGFVIRSNTSSMNNSGDTFVFAAFASSPFKFANAR